MGGTVVQLVNATIGQSLTKVNDTNAGLVFDRAFIAGPQAEADAEIISMLLGYGSLTGKGVLSMPLLAPVRFGWARVQSGVSQVQLNPNVRRSLAAVSKSLQSFNSSSKSTDPSAAAAAGGGEKNGGSGMALPRKMSEEVQWAAVYEAAPEDGSTPLAECAMMGSSINSSTISGSPCMVQLPPELDLQSAATATATATAATTTARQQVRTNSSAASDADDQKNKAHDEAAAAVAEAAAGVAVNSNVVKAALQLLLQQLNQVAIYQEQQEQEQGSNATSKSVRTAPTQPPCSVRTSATADADATATAIEGLLQSCGCSVACATAQLEFAAGVMLQQEVTSATSVLYEGFQLGGGRRTLGVFPSEGLCCLSGLGAHEEGCNTMPHGP
jgi:hypothetical protein